ncbi:MAG TPA: phytanoyl-CoA dioxygenase family protein [Roseiflexaceae bacterium]|nr:phytanoyl-CoA dioxygenase family protein [Roseiflexaceae bacterium]
MVTEQHKREFAEQGYTIARGLFSAEEVEQYLSHFMQLRKHGKYEGDFSGVGANDNDPLKRYPRMIHMHRWDQTSLEWLVAPRISEWLSALLGNEPYAVQTMLYFKPPGARGQALHQDNFYLRAQPGTCAAAWMALDPCDESNGCMQVVPGSHRWPLLCTEKADTSISFTDVTVPIPEGQEVAPVLMQPGDVLFFNGQLVHGSYPNTTTDRFRRALIGHYIEGDATQVAQFYHPALHMDGTPLTLDVAQGGGACGVWVEGEDEPAIEMVGSEGIVRKHE